MSQEWPQGGRFTSPLRKCEPCQDWLQIDRNRSKTMKKNKTASISAKRTLGTVSVSNESERLQGGQCNEKAPVGHCRFCGVLRCCSLRSRALLIGHLGRGTSLPIWRPFSEAWRGMRHLLNRISSPSKKLNGYPGRLFDFVGDLGFRSGDGRGRTMLGVCPGQPINHSHIGNTPIQHTAKPIGWPKK